METNTQKGACTLEICKVHPILFLLTICRFINKEKRSKKENLIILNKFYFNLFSKCKSKGKSVVNK